LDLKKEDLLQLYKTLLTIRRTEQMMLDLYKKGEISGTILPCLGQEAIPTAFSKILKESDYVVTGHRGGGHYIARNCDYRGLWAEIYGKSEGTMRGKGGQMHLVDIEKNTIAGNAIVGANWVLGTGAGLAAKLEAKGAIAAVFGGEGSTNRGTFHEGINMAAVKKLPVIFVCEFNSYQLWNHYTEILPIDNISERAASYGIPGVTVDGNDVLAIYEAASKLAKRARNGDGPSILECKTFKYTDSGSNLRLEKEEIEKWQQDKDPVQMFRQHLYALKILDDAAESALKKKIDDKILSALGDAKNCPEPDQAEAFKHVYSMPVGGGDYR
jgi:acetoin:2,6-dichlorophenolindophenol oxidoreductase subunit alpha